MSARPVVSVFSSAGVAQESTALPAVFTVPIRPDIVSFVHTNMAKNRRQPYAVSKRAGHQVRLLGLHWHGIIFAVCRMLRDRLLGGEIRGWVLARRRCSCAKSCCVVCATGGVGETCLSERCTGRPVYCCTYRCDQRCCKLPRTFASNIFAG